MHNAGKKFDKGDVDREISDANVSFNGSKLFYS